MHLEHFHGFVQILYREVPVNKSFLINQGIGQITSRRKYSLFLIIYYRDISNTIFFIRSTEIKICSATEIAKWIDLIIRKNIYRKKTEKR